MRRNVPERERMTIDSVSTRSPTTRTPRSSAPLVTPVAATKTSSPWTRSSAVRTRSRSKPAVDQALPLVVVPRPQLPLHRAAEALDRGSGDHALRRSADAHEEVDAGARLRGRDRGRDVAVADEVHARSGLAELGDEVVVAVALEDDDREVVDGARPSPRRRARGSRSASRRCRSRRPPPGRPRSCPCTAPLPGRTSSRARRRRSRRSRSASRAP